MMDLAPLLVVAILLVLVIAQAWLIYGLIRRYGQVLLSQERLDDRLASIERTLDEMTDWLYGASVPPGASSPGKTTASPAPPLDAVTGPVEPPSDPPTSGEPSSASECHDAGLTAPAALVAASVTTVYMERLTRRWRQEASAPMVLPRALPTVPDPHQAQAADGAVQPAIVLQARRDDQRIVPSGEPAPVRFDDAPEAGLFAVYDWTTRRIVWQQRWGPQLIEPSGYCFADGCIYLADSAGAGVLQIDLTDQPGRLLKRLSHPAFNDLHSVERTRRGLLVASTGVDALLEIDLDGNLLYEWWAGEHGYTRTPSGHERPARRGQEHRDQQYHTRFHTTHLNEAVFRDPDERYLLALLWAQGQVVQIDRALPPAEQRAEVVLDGLSRPHGLKQTPSGWMVCSSMSGEIILLDEDLRETDRIAYASAWIHDCLMLDSGRIILNDAQSHRLAELDGPPWRVVHVTPYPNNWRLARLRAVPVEYHAAFQHGVPIATSDHR